MPPLSVFSYKKLDITSLLNENFLKLQFGRVRTIHQITSGQMKPI